MASCVSSSDRPPSAHKRQKTTASPLSSFANSTSILEIVAENGWFPWHVDEENRQSPDFSNLRLLSKDMKALMDSPKYGGPDLASIVDFLDRKNGFNSSGEGFCDHCFSLSGITGGCSMMWQYPKKNTCETCNDDDDYTSCKCEESHRYGPVLLQLDPRLNASVEFGSLPMREQAKRLLQFLRQVTANFHSEYYKVCEGGNNPDLTIIDPKIHVCYDYDEEDVLINELEEYNRPFFYFIHHLLFTGWAENDIYNSPGARSPFRGRFLADGRQYGTWNEGGGWKESFSSMIECFLCLHKSDEAKSVPGGYGEGTWGIAGYECSRRYSPSQIQYIPATIRRCVMNCVDLRAESLLGKAIAGSIDLYRLVRETYDTKEEELSKIQWMPCFGVAKDEFAPLDDFQGYNPQHYLDNISATGLLWSVDEDTSSSSSSDSSSSDD